jgi:hypothetical protein
LLISSQTQRVPELWFSAAPGEELEVEMPKPTTLVVRQFRRQM